MGHTGSVFDRQSGVKGGSGEEKVFGSPREGGQMEKVFGYGLERLSESL